MSFRSREPLTVIEAVNWNRAAGSQRKTLIVLHCMQAPNKLTTAEWCGNYFAGRTRDKDGHLVPAPMASANFAVDADSVVQCVPAEMWAYHAPGGKPSCNQRGIGIEMPGYASWERSQWLEPVLARPMLQRAARLCGELAAHFNIPIGFLDAEDLRAMLSGFTTHEQVSLAFRKTTHVDPGKGFPIREFLDWTRSYTSGAWAEV